ncbi:4'-phosphopantetheinyl transferase superfamily protein [Texas Phoenix palm phytoplasma]|uniref:Holo-[acyl-carrier-protein] synthase n=1 Tax=Texas Phoenix palm phytoplasma TaxID=176709 RepID=A0ABS5BI05_9MOLU|nr:4'-phosphopantetheinyl transferase superfamily protein [Texas Phoenix palm phytoplasma]MBP3059210.1 4'-phosphopantetheinyl transferase superfamily protein [Texas Phoenix palm phytoplasma]
MKNIGIDLIEIKKIKKIGIEKFVNRIFSPSEKELYDKISNLKRKYSFIAGRLAAKEAIFKAYRKGNLKNNYSDWSILNDLEFGFPYVEGPLKKKIIISITHTDNYAAAFVLLLF